MSERDPADLERWDEEYADIEYKFELSERRDTPPRRDRIKRGRIVSMNKGKLGLKKHNSHTVPKIFRDRYTQQPAPTPENAQPGSDLPREIGDTAVRNVVNDDARPAS